MLRLWEELQVHQKMPHSQNKACEQGMTLIEILVAIFIFAIAMTTIFGSFYSVIGQVGVIEKKTETYEMAQTCLNQISLDLSCLHVSFHKNFSPEDLTDDPDLHRVAGEIKAIDGKNFSGIRFSSDAHLPLEGNPQTGIAQITYFVGETSDNRFALYRSDMLFPYEPVDENGNDPILCENLTDFKILYYDEEGAEHESWDSDSDEWGYATPRAILITLVLGEEPDETVFQTMICLRVFRNKKQT